VSRAPEWLIVLAGAVGETCRGADCQRTIYFNATNTPVDCSVAGGRIPTATEDGRGFNHFLTCPNADQFHGTGRSKAKRDTSAQGELL
jgi:hypothetical protein